MPREFTRAERVSDAIQQEVSVLICDSIRDPRVGMVSVTDVEVSRDLAYAKVHVTFVGEKSEEEIKGAIRALNGAAGYLRKLLASSIKMRKTPQLTFLFDESGRRGQQLSALIDYAVSSEKNRDNIANDDSVDSKGN
ncbi:MAG: 30S ribosome-binding factor RbfA [Porticoccaceae bacterium]|nr:30S ribosome-binding factor RbfA [Porticoccaceae bacterium]|tara:strand:- start:1668 stop:2078 length:411 start_codon:yes stop_codon:yes gene_type:complete